MGAFEDWITGFSPDTTTPETYSHYFKGYLSFLAMSAHQVLEKRQRDLEGTNLVDRMFFENRLKQYLALLETRGKSKSVRLQVWKASKSFFSTYGVPLQLRKQDAPKGDYEETIRPFNKKEIRKLLSVADPMQRALILTFKDTGLSSCDISRLRILNLGGSNPPKSWREVLDQDNAPVPVTGKRKKTHVKFQSFLGLESAEALRVYLEQREKGTMYLDRRGVPAEELGSDSLVFRCKTKLKGLTNEHIQRIVQVLVMKAGLHGVSSHSFRRFFKTTLENPELGIHPTWVKRMMGHKLAQIERAYSHPTDRALREAYERAMPFLSILPRHVDEERLSTLETQVGDERRLRERSDERILLMERTIKRLLDELEKDEEYEQGT